MMVRTARRITAGPAPGEDCAPTLATLLCEGVLLLTEAGVQNARHEAIWILEFALGTSRLALQLDGHRTVRREELQRARELFARRAAREPLQYILGTQEFCGLEFQVGPGVLIPRPETEPLVEELTRAFCCASAPIIADIGTGSGCIAVALAHALPHATIYATDRSQAALHIARQNAARHGVGHRVIFLAGDLFEPLRRIDLAGWLEAVVSNPPYIPEEELASLQPEVGAFEPGSEKRANLG